AYRHIDPQDAQSDLLQWVYPDLEIVGEPADFPAYSAYHPTKPFKVSCLRSGRLLWSKDVDQTAFHGTPDGDEQGWESHVISSNAPGYDAQGNVISASQNGHDGSSLSAAIAYNGFGGVSRELAPDGTITRYEYDWKGRLERTFRGTSDISE